jgi:hypothetical protein
MGEEKKPDYVMTADGELVPTDEIRSADLPEPKQKQKIELPAFPKSPAAPPKAKVPPPPPPPPTDELELSPPRFAPKPPPVPAPPPAAPPPPPPRPAQVQAAQPAQAKRPPPPLPPLDPREMVEPKVWTGERTLPDSSAHGGGGGALAQLAQMAAEEQLAELEPIAEVEIEIDVEPIAAKVPLADDLALPSAPRSSPRATDESLSSAAELEALIRDQKYRALMEQVSEIDGDESLDDPPPPPPAAAPTASQDVPVIRGTGVAPPPQRSAGMRPSVTGSGAPEEPPRRGPPRVTLHRTIKEKNRGR